MFSHQYIKMCLDGQEDIVSVRVYNSAKGKWLENFAFKKGDYFNHPKMGEDEVREVAHVEKINLRAVDDLWPYKIEECIWVPTADQFVKEVQQIPWALNKDMAKDYYELQNHELFLLSDEENVLSYWMEKRRGKKWDFDNQKWISNKPE